MGLLTHTPVVYTVHGTMHMDTHKKWIHYFLEQLLVCWIQYDMIISVSHKVLNYNLSTKNVKVIYPGIDTHKCRLSHVTKKKDGKNFIFVGRIDWQKWLNFLISAIASIGKEKLISSWFHLNIVGDGPDRQKIEDQVSQAGIEKFISFKGKLIKQDVVDEYRANTIFILPSLAEGQPVVVMEAMCCKLPIIATDVGDNKNVIKSEFGMVVPSGNSEVLAEAITHYLDMGDKEIEQQGLAGYQEVIEHYDRKNIANQISEVFDELIQNYNKKVL